MTSLATVLFQSDQGALGSLQPQLSPLLTDAPAHGLGIDALRSQVTAAVTDLLQMPVGNLALAAWEKHQGVRAACEQTRRLPGSRQVVRLLEHTIKTEQRPTIELMAGGTSYPVLTLTVEVELKVPGVSLVIEEGRIVGVRPGPASATATLSAGQVRLAQGSLSTINLYTPRGETRTPDTRLASPA